VNGSPPFTRRARAESRTVHRSSQREHAQPRPSAYATLDYLNVTCETSDATVTITAQPDPQEMPTIATTKAILKEDGAEAAFEAVRDKAHEAEEILTELLQQDKEEVWTVKALYDAVLERRPDLGHTAMGIAFGALEKAGIVRLDKDLRVHAS